MGVNIKECFLNICDYVPLVSTVKSVITLSSKAAHTQRDAMSQRVDTIATNILQKNRSNAEMQAETVAVLLPKKPHFWCPAQGTTLRQILLLIPGLGNIIVGSFDLVLKMKILKRIPSTDLLTAQQIALLTANAKLGNAYAAYRLGEEARGKNEWIEAISWLKMAIAMGSKEALRPLEYSYQAALKVGATLSSDDEKHLRLELAAVLEREWDAGGVLTCIEEAGGIYARYENKPKAEHCYQTARAHGSVTAGYNLCLLKFGQAAEWPQSPHKNEIVKILEEAEKKTECPVHVQEALAILYEGSTSYKDHAKAAVLYNRAANRLAEANRKTHSGPDLELQRQLRECEQGRGRMMDFLYTEEARLWKLQNSPGGKELLIKVLEAILSCCQQGIEKQVGRVKFTTVDVEAMLKTVRSKSK